MSLPKWLRRPEIETVLALTAGFGVFVVWLLWAWLIAPAIQASVQDRHEHASQAASAPGSAAAETTGASAVWSQPINVIANRSQVRVEFPQHRPAAPEAGTSGPLSAADYFSRLGQSGDLYGGANALFASLALVAVGWAGALQRRTMREARAREARNQFETTFFELLKLSREVIGGFERTKKVNGETRIQRGYGALNGVAAKVFGSSMTPAGAMTSTDFAKHLVEAYKIKVYRRHPSALGPYFRLLFQTFDLVATAKGLDDDERVQYANIARAQISEGAVLLLALNGLTWRGWKFVPLIEEFGLLEHMHHGYLDRYKDALLCGYREAAFKGSEERANARDQDSPKPGPRAFDRAPDQRDFEVTGPPDDDLIDEV